MSGRKAVSIETRFSIDPAATPEQVAAVQAALERSITRAVDNFEGVIIDELPLEVRLEGITVDPPVARYRCRTCKHAETDHAFDSCEGGPDGWEPIPAQTTTNDSRT